MATPAVPRRHGRPKLSVMITAGGTPKGRQVLPAAPRRCRRDRPAAAGRARRRRSAPTLDWSMPALAMTKPSRCSTISTLGRERTTRTDSDRISSTSRGSFWISAASSIARAEGVTVASSTHAALGLGDDLLRHHQHVAGARLDAAAREAARRSGPPDRRPALTIGRPGTASSSSALLRSSEASCAAAAATCSPYSLRKRAWSGPGAWNTR